MTAPHGAGAGSETESSGGLGTQVEPAAHRRRGAWRTLAHGAPVFAITVVANAAVQAALVALAPDLALSPLGVLLAALSAAALLAASVVVWRTAAWAAGSASEGLAALAVRCVVVGALTVLAAVALPYLVPVVIALGCVPLAAGSLRRSSMLAARHPLRLTGLAVTSVVVVLLVQLAALVLGLFLTGWPASGATWLTAGLAAAILASHWQALATRLPPPERRILPA